MISTNCNICKQPSAQLFEALVLNKYSVKYFKCINCGFIQTEKPYWLEEAYHSPIASIDAGILQRNILLSDRVSAILDGINAGKGIYLDYGGGYGIFVRLMRDKGFDFYLTDRYAENLFAKHLELEDAVIKTGFTCLTAFEVFEHLDNPVAEIEKMFTFSDTIIFSTELQPVANVESISDWWYFVPEGGQHVSFYSAGSLEQLKQYFNCHLYTDNVSLHILSKIPLKNPFEQSIEQPSLLSRIKNRLFNNQSKAEKTIQKESLLMKDFEFYKNKLTNGNI